MSRTFRSIVQPVVRAAAGRGADRRVDMLADLRGYRIIERDDRPSETPSAAFARFIDPRRSIAKAGVAAFSLSLLVPSFASGMGRPASALSVAATADSQPIARLALSQPDPVADFRLEPEPISPAPAPQPEVEPLSLALTALMPGGGYGAVVTASWYGPGFYENRLPCWRWLEASSQPVQLLPDTWGVAHKTLPCGTLVTLAHGANVVTVPVVDRGPYVAGREIDLSPRVKAALGCTDLCTVVMQIR